jgi:competence protein ComGC
MRRTRRMMMMMVMMVVMMMMMMMMMLTPPTISPAPPGLGLGGAAAVGNLVAVGVYAVTA